MRMVSVKTGMFICPQPHTSSTEGRRKGPVSFGPAHGLAWLPWKQSGASDLAIWDPCEAINTVDKPRVTSMVPLTRK